MYTSDLRTTLELLHLLREVRRLIHILSNLSTLRLTLLSSWLYQNPLHTQRWGRQAWRKWSNVLLAILIVGQGLNNRASFLGHLRCKTLRRCSELAGLSRDRLHLLDEWWELTVAGHNRRMSRSLNMACL